MHAISLAIFAMFLQAAPADQSSVVVPGAVVPGAVVPSIVPSIEPSIVPSIEVFLQAASPDAKQADAALAQIAAGWKDGYTPMLVEMADLMRRISRVRGDPWEQARAGTRILRLTRFLEQQTGKSFGANLDRWQEWMWNLPYDPHPQYVTFKRRLYTQLYPGFGDFFRSPLRTATRLDQVEWGGLGINQIPPLRFPRHIPAAEAQYLEDDNVVFGVYVDGLARAYPKRILAWHELAQDRIGSLEVTLVYCTLCGTVVPYDSRIDGEVHTFGTSGFLYQSNKLMFDDETKTLWSSVQGVPLVGPLAGSGVRLSILPIVTTTWGEWRRAHPNTTALSIQTGFPRDYSEGAPYREYFSNDDLLFNVSKMDDRLKNKDEVLALRLPSASGGGEAPPAVIAADFLRARPVYHLTVAGQNLVILTTPAGANRVYRSGTHRFRSPAEDGRIIDSDRETWIVEEDQLRASSSAVSLPRVPAHRTFWFAWYVQHPDTLLIK